LTELKELASKDGGEDFYILLNGNMRSSKHISWDGEKFLILHLIDSAEDQLTEEEIMDDSITNIGKAMSRGVFFVYVK